MIINMINTDLLTFTLLTLLSCIWVIYMLNYFTTKYSIAHPLTYFTSKYWHHPIGTFDKPISMVCQFGKDASWILLSFLILRYLYVLYINSNGNSNINNKNQIIRILSKLCLIITMLLSLLNFNVLVYLIPYYIMEYNIIINYL